MYILSRSNNRERPQFVTYFLYQIAYWLLLLLKMETVSKEFT